MGKEGTGGLFSQGGGGKPFWGVGGGAAGCKIAPQACTCHANPLGTIVPVPTRGLAAPGGPGQDAGAVLPEGVHLVPERTPKSGPRKAAPAPSLLTPLFGFLAPVPFGEGTCFDLPIFPPFTCGSGAWRAVSARSQLVGSKRGRAASRGLSATQTLNF